MFSQFSYAFSRQTLRKYRKIKFKRKQEKSFVCDSTSSTERTQRESERERETRINNCVRIEPMMIILRLRCSCLQILFCLFAHSATNAKRKITRAQTHAMWKLLHLVPSYPSSFSFRISLVFIVVLMTSRCEISFQA